MVSNPDRPEATTPPDPYAGLNLDPVSTVDRVAEELRRALFDGELEPGTPLREVALAEALGVSRSTIREALGTLVAEGLVDRVTHKGIQVRRLDAEEVQDVCRARAVIESAGMRRWDQAEETDRDAVRAALARFGELVDSEYTAAEFTAAHLEIHRRLAVLTGSRRLVAVAEGLHAEVRLALAHVDRARGNATEQVHSHADLVRLLESGDLDAAAAALADHLAGAELSMLEAVALEAVPPDRQPR